MSEVLYLSNGDVLVPVTVDHAGRKLALRCKYDKNLVTEFRCMRGANFNRELMQWEVTDCRRNWMQLESLQVDPEDPTQFRVPHELVRLRGPLQHVEPNRTCLMPHQKHTLDHGYTYHCGIWAEEQGVGKSLAAIELMEHVSGLWWYVAPLKVVRAFELELRKWKCTNLPRLLNYDILERETEPHFQCHSCGESNVPERRTWQKAKVIKHDPKVCDKQFDPEVGKCACGWYPGQVEAAYPRCQACGTQTELHRSLWWPLPQYDCPIGVIFDEASRLKNGGSNRAQAAQALADRIRVERDGWIIEMTGTPTPHDPADWHSEVEIALPGLLRESSRNHLERRMGIYEDIDLGDRVVGNIVGWKEDEVVNLRQRMGNLVLVYLAKDVLDLPPLVKDVIDLEPSPELLRAAKLAAESSQNAAQALNRLRQLSDGFQYGGLIECPTCQGMNLECTKCNGIGFKEVDDVRRAPCPKDVQLRADLAYNEEVGRLVVYAGFRASIDRCVDVCREEGWSVLRCDGRGWAWFDADVADEMELLQELDLGTRTSKFEKLVVVAHPKSGGLGQNWTAPRENIFYSNDFDAEARWQAEKRTHRNGQPVTRGIRIKDYSHLPTDRYVLKNLELKRNWQDISLGEVIACL